jgi:hypothetical protein
MKSIAGWRLFPLIFFELYLNFTVLTLAFGPWPWPVDNAVELYAYLVAAHIAFAVGYVLAVSSRFTIHRPQLNHVNALFIAALLLSLLIALPTSFARTGSVIPDLAFGIQDPGEAYGRAVFRGQSGGEHVIFEYLRILLSPVLALLLPLLVVYWSTLSYWKRLLGSASALWVVSLYVATGTNKGLADFVLILPWLLLLRQFALGSTKLPVFRFSIAAVVSVVLMLVFFAYGQLSREGGAAIGSIFGAPLFITADPDHWLTGSLPDEARIALESIFRYLNAGYYALSRCFQFDFDSTFGVGNSMFLSRNFDALFDTHWTLSNTYPAKLEIAEGWGVFLLWHSIYPWLASDFGFPGTLLLVALIGWMLAATWVTAVESRHPAAISLFAYLCVAVYYFPANNQLMQSGESCVGFFFTAAWWIVVVLSNQFLKHGPFRHNDPKSPNETMLPT